MYFRVFAINFVHETVHVSTMIPFPCRKLVFLIILGSTMPLVSFVVHVYTLCVLLRYQVHFSSLGVARRVGTQFATCHSILTSGMSLIGEGFMSAAYHICPTSSNYQFGESDLKLMQWLFKTSSYGPQHTNF